MTYTLCSIWPCCSFGCSFGCLVATAKCVQVRTAGFTRICSCELGSGFGCCAREEARSRAAVSKPAAPLGIPELALPAWDPNFQVRILLFFFLFLWKVTPDMTVISKIGFVEFFKVFNFCKSLNHMAARCAACLPCEIWQELVGFTDVCR